MPLGKKCGSSVSEGLTWTLYRRGFVRCVSAGTRIRRKAAVFWKLQLFGSGVNRPSGVNHERQPDQDDLYNVKAKLLRETRSSWDTSCDILRLQKSSFHLIVAPETSGMHMKIFAGTPLPTPSLNYVLALTSVDASLLR
ncbi:hypothetical protein MRX96_058860 [Rhipicephalus microplus]